MKDKFTFFTLLSVAITTLASLCSGYNMGIIAGVLSALTNEFGLSPIDESFLISISFLGALFGSLSTGYLSDRFGRKFGLMIAGIWFIIGGVVATFSTTYQLLCFGRFLVGLGAGTVLVAVPLYIVEISPDLYRGRFVAFNPILNTAGILIAYFISDFYTPALEWRLLLSTSLIFSIPQVIGVYFLSETPVWLLRNQKKQQALSALEKLRDGDEWRENFDKTNEKNEGKAQEITSSKFRKVFILVPLLYFLQQITGISGVIYFAPEIIKKKLHSSESLSLFFSLEIALVMFLSTLLAPLILDKFKRRSLLMFGVVVMMISLLFYAYAGQFVDSNFFGVSGLILFVGTYSISLGPLTSLVSSELSPTKFRGKILALGGVVNWLTSYCLSLFLLPAVFNFGPGRTFGFFIFMCVVAFYFYWRYLPETEGKVLE
jgi:sugar porter (SP) family MFS transporter